MAGIGSLALDTPNDQTLDQSANFPSFQIEESTLNSYENVRRAQMRNRSKQYDLMPKKGSPVAKGKINLTNYKTLSSAKGSVGSAFAGKKSQAQGISNYRTGGYKIPDLSKTGEKQRGGLKHSRGSHVVGLPLSSSQGPQSLVPKNGYKVLGTSF